MTSVINPLKRTTATFLLLVMGLGGMVFAQRPDDLETYMSNEDLKVMDQFEEHALNRADKFYADKKYKEAETEYESFILEFPKSRAIPYALVRKGRSRQLVDKRFEAIKIYNEVLDYFPDDINFAAAALYYIGESHLQNGNQVEAMKAFTEMAQDKDYRQHRLAAGAILSLANMLEQQEKFEEAVKFFEQVAADFRITMGWTAFQAVEKALYHHVRRARNEKRVRDLYIKVKGFDRHRAYRDSDLPPVDKLLDDRTFAGQVGHYVNQYGGFDEKAVAQRRDYFLYWAKVFENRFPDWDEFQVQIFGWAGDKWEEKIDAQFRRVKPDFDRIIWWLRNCWGRNYPKRVQEYYNLIEFAKLDFEKYFTLLTTLYDNCGEKEVAINLLDKMNLSQRTEAEKEKIIIFFMGRREEGALNRVLGLLKDRDRADYLLLTYYVEIRDSGRGIPQADIVAKQPLNADYALWEKSTFLVYQSKWAEAIEVCRMVKRGAKGFYRISDCYVKLGKPDEAIQQLREIELFFKDQSSRACFMVAGILGAVGRKKEQVAVLYEVGKKYKGTGEASQAHQILESMGLRTFTGEDAVED